MSMVGDYVCPHCDGAGALDQADLDLGYGNVATVFTCEACEGTGTCPVDEDLVCSCDECVVLPVDQRFTLAPLPVLP